MGRKRPQMYCCYELIDTNNTYLLPQRAGVSPTRIIIIRFYGRCGNCEQWSHFAELNKVAHEALLTAHAPARVGSNASHGPHQRPTVAMAVAARVRILDRPLAGARGLAQRSDAHRASGCELTSNVSATEDHCQDDTPSRRCSGGDCLHYHMPGAIDLLPRAYAHMLLSMNTVGRISD